MQEPSEGAMGHLLNETMSEAGFQVHIAIVMTQQLSFGVVLLASMVAAGLGAFHALEPGHGKTVVAAYLNQATRDWYTHAATSACSATAIFSTAAVTAGS